MIILFINFAIFVIFNSWKYKLKVALFYCFHTLSSSSRIYIQHNTPFFPSQNHFTCEYILQNSCGLFSLRENCYKNCFAQINHFPFFFLLLYFSYWKRKSCYQLFFFYALFVFHCSMKRKNNNNSRCNNNRFK